MAMHLLLVVTSVSVGSGEGRDIFIFALSVRSEVVSKIEINVLYF